MGGYVVASVIIILVNFILFWKYRKCISQKVDLLSNEMSEKIIRSVPDMIFIVDNHFKIRKIYNSDHAKLSVPMSEIIGRSLKDCVDKECLDWVLTGFEEALNSDNVVEVEYSVTHKDKKVFYEGRFKRVQENLVACFERDITERRRKDAAIQQNERLMAMVLDNMPMPLIIKDINDGLKYTFWNKQCEKNGGYNREEIIGKTDIDIYGEERGEYYQSVDYRIIAKGGSFREQDIYQTPDGKKHVSIVNKNVISNDVHNWLLATRWDITDLVEMQEQLQEANRQLQLAFAVTFTVPIIWDIEKDIILFKFPEFKKQNTGFHLNKDGLSSTESVRNVHPDEREDLTQLFDDLKNGRIEIVSREIRYDIEGKYENYYELFLTVEKKDNKGNPVRVIGTMRNITERKRYEKELLDAKENIEKVQEVNQLILDHSNNGLVYLTTDFQVQWANVGKYSNHPLAGRYKTGICCYQNVLGQKEPCQSCAAKRAMLSGKIETGGRNLPGGVAIEVTAVPVFDKDSKVQGVVLKFEDVTIRRQAALELERAKEAAEKSDNLKSQFLSNMSHEIRTPLNAIVGFSELLAVAENEEEKDSYVSVINRNNELLLQLINDILDLSKIEANTLEFVYSDVDLNEMLKNLEMSTRCKSENEEVEISFIPQIESCFIRTDKNRLLQVFSNLISNSLKFTDKGYIRYGYEVKENGMRFFVSDTGKGIPEEEQSEIFKRFVKLDNFKSGTGLGLPICRNIINKLGGKIGVDSKSGSGCTFWFTLPVLPIPQLSGNKILPGSTLSEKRFSSGEKPVLLIAEDVVDNYTLYYTMLRDKCTLLHAWNGEEAVALYKEHDPDVIIMDIKMPVMNGYEATAEIRKSDVDIPIIAVSAYAFSEDIDRIMTSGFTDYIAKPITRKSLQKIFEYL